MANGAPPRPGLAKAKVVIPMVGMDQGIDERVLPVGKLKTVLNGQYDKRGRISKRNGFDRFANSVKEGSPSVIPNVRTLFSTGEELCLVANERLYTFNESPLLDSWYDRGPVSPCTGKTSTIFRDSQSFPQGDMARSGDNVIYAAQQHTFISENSPATDDERYTITTFVKTADGQVLSPQAEVIASSGSATRLHGVRCLSSTGNLHVMWMNNDGTAADVVYKIADWSTVSRPIDGPTGSTTLATDGLYSGENDRTYDAIGIDFGDNAGDYLFAYVDNTANKDIQIDRRNAAHALQVAFDPLDMPNNPYKLVALADSPTDATAFYALCVARTAEGVDTVELYSINSTTMALNWGGPVDMRQGQVALSAAREVVHNLGVVEGNGRVACTWSVRELNIDGGGPFVTTYNWRTENRSTDLAGGDLDALYRIHNSNVISRPWYENNRCYAWLMSAHADAENSFNSDPGETNPDSFGTEVFEVQWMADLVVDTTNPIVGNRQPILVGVHNVGASPPHSVNSSANLHKTLDIGSTNNVVDMGSSEWRTMVPTMTYWQSGLQHRFSEDELAMDFAEAPLVATVHKGAAVIGGAMWTWYAGAWTEELSFLQPPILVDDAGYSISGLPNPIDITIGALPLTETYIHIAVWETYDSRGVLHRSVPGNQVTVTTAGTEDAIQFAAKTLPSTNRVSLPGRRTALVLYRQDTDGIFKRVNSPVRVEENVANSHITGDIYDYGAALGAPLYIDGGVEVEASCPEGGRIPLAAANRLWLADFFRRDRIQYSKRLAPGTALEDALAPEFNEAFGYLVRSGQRITGMGELDDKVIVFTEEEIYAIAGRGPDNGGGNNDFSGLTLVSNDAGCTEARSVVAYPDGLLFLSKAGLYRLGRDLQVSFIGNPVEDLLASYPTVNAATLVANETELRIVCTDAGATESIILVYNYQWDAWSYWLPKTSAGTTYAIQSAALHKGVYYLAQANGAIWQQDATSWLDQAREYVPLEIETAWIQAAEQSGWQRVRNVIPLLDRKDPHDLEVSIASDFATTYDQTDTFDNATIAAFPDLPLEQVKSHVIQQKCQAIKVRIRDLTDDATVTGEGYTIAGVALELGVKRGTVKVVAGQRT